MRHFALAPAFFFLLISDAAAQYCTPAFAASACFFTNNFWITTTTFGSLSGSETGCQSAVNALRPQTGSVTAGQTYTLSVTKQANSYQCTIQVWADWDNNAVFNNNVDEYLLNATQLAGGSNTSTASITVPSGANIGMCRLRVMVNYLTGGGANGCTPGALSQGEFLDYNISVLAGTPCSGIPAVLPVAPSSPSICSAATQASTVTPDASGYTYQWQESNAIGGSYNNVTGGSGATTSTFTTPVGGSLPFFPTYYRCNVTCTASGQTTPSAVSTVTLNSFINCYCTTTFSSAAATSVRGLTNVNLVGNTVTINNTTAANTANPSPYNLYPANVADLSVGASYPLKTTVGIATNNLHYVAAWIDYDQNGYFGGYTSGGVYNGTGDFNAALVNERIATVGPTTNVQTTTNFTVPNGAAVGTTAMRVRYRYGASLAAIGACQQITGSATTGGAGEVEDYRVSISASSCTGPPNAGAVSVINPGSGNVCPGGTATLAVSGQTTGVSGITFQWQLWDGVSYANILNATSSTYTTPALPNATLGDLSNLYKCLIGCTPSSQSAIQVNPATVTIKPTPSISVSPFSATICNTGSTGLTASNAASGSTSFSWSPSTGLSAANVTNPSASPSATTTYTVTGTASGCSANANVTVTVNPSSVTVTPASPTTGIGGSAVLTASATTTNAGAMTYAWTPSSSLSSATGASVTASPLSTTTYTVTATDAGGCSRTGTTTVKVTSGTPGSATCGYTYSYGSPSGYTTAASLGTPTSLTWADDQVYAAQPIGFTFSFNDCDYTTLGISSNGFIWFGSGTCSASQYTPLSSTAGQVGSVDGIASVFGADMAYFSAATAISYVTSGTPGSRVFTIEWMGAGIEPATGPSRSDFQIRLYEASGNIEFWYQSSPYDLTWVGENGVFSGQVGIRGSSTSDFQNRTNGCEGPWASSSAGTLNTQGMSIAGGWNCAGSWPASGKVFVYAPTAKPTITPAGQQNVCTGSGVSLTAVNSGGMSSPSYQWQTYTYPTSNTDIGAATSSSYTATPPSSGNYFYVVKLTSGSCVRTSNATAVVAASCGPLPFNVTGGSNCGSTTVGLDGSESGITYTLKLNGNDVTTAPGTGNAISLGAQTAAGTYTVVGVNGLLVSTNMTGSAIVTATPTWYIDADGDTYYPAPQTQCGFPGPGWTTTAPSGGAGDCNDNNSAVNPGAAEICGNGADENCDGLAAGNFTVSVPTPTSATVCVGVPGPTYSVVVTGAGSYTYQWFYNGVNNNFSGSSAGALNGAQTASYTPPSSAVPNTLYFYCVVTQVGTGCSGVVSATSSRIVTACSSTPNDQRVAAVPVNSSVFGLCSSTTGDLTNATVSAEATTTAQVVTGEDVWYKFIANSVGVRIQVAGAAVNTMIELQDAAGNLIAFENILPGTGTEILNHFNGGSPLVSGQTYYIAVRNVNSGAGTGTFTICVQSLKATNCNISLAGFPNFGTCNLLQAISVGAQIYSFAFTSTTNVSALGNNPHTYSVNTSGGFSSVPLSSLFPTLSYNVVINCTYNLLDGAGNAENFTIPPSGSCTINMVQHEAVFLRTTDQCPNIRTGTSVIGANVWVCGAHSYEWTFSPALGLPLTIQGSPENRFLAISAAVAQGLTCGNYDVTIRPRFLAGGVVFSSAVPQVKCLNFACSGGLALEEASEMSNPSVRMSNVEGDHVAMYPNPNNGQMLNLNITGVNGDQVSVRILDATGRAVFTERYTSDGTLNKIISFDRPLAGGLYMVELMYDGKLETERLIVQR
jgi:hypothetical protein